MAASEVYQMIGWVVVWGLFACMVVALILSCWIAIARWFPRFHAGAPKNPIEWHCYDKREIITARGGSQCEPTGRGPLIQQLNLLWWAGLSSRNSARWFFGFMRWKNISDGL